MSDQPPKEKESTPKQGIYGLIEHVLDFIDRPWKALVILLFIVVIGAGYMFYLKLDQLFVQVFQKNEPHLVTTIDPDIWKDLGRTETDMIVVVSVNMSENVQRLVYASLDGAPWKDMVKEAPAIADVNSYKIVRALVHGRNTCADTSEISRYAQSLIDHGIKRICIIPIKVRSGPPFGAIYLGWRAPLSENEEATALEVAARVGNTLIQE